MCLMSSFSSESSIHGIHFIFTSSHSIVTRVFWSVALIFSFCGFFYYLNMAHTKWYIRPDVALKVSQRPMKEIPFPAVTLCSPVFAKRSLANFRMENESLAGIFGSLSASECKYIHANEVKWILSV